MITLLELRKITSDNYEECLSLRTIETSEEFVDSVAYSLAEAWVFHEETHPFAIYAEDVMVGFVSMSIADNNPQIINFLIDSSFQNKGYGSSAAKLCIDYLSKEFNANRISLPVNLENKGAVKFWHNLGFEQSNTVEDGYLYMRLYLEK